MPISSKLLRNSSRNFSEVCQLFRKVNHHLSRSTIKAYHNSIVMGRWAILCSKLSKQKSRSDLARLNPLRHGTYWTQMGLVFIKGVDIKGLNIWYYNISIGKSLREQNIRPSWWVFRKGNVRIMYWMSSSSFTNSIWSRRILRTSSERNKQINASV